jgi:phosphoglycerol transferase MdoB-like AlkP superfamily enzyme
MEDGMLLVGSLILLALLVSKEVVNGSTDPQLQRLDRALNISLFPMLGAFFLLLIFKTVEFLH